MGWSQDASQHLVLHYQHSSVCEWKADTFIQFWNMVGFSRFMLYGREKGDSVFTEDYWHTYADILINCSVCWRLNWRPWWGGKLCLQASIRHVACWKSEVGLAEWTSKLRLRFSGHAVSLQTKPRLCLWESTRGDRVHTTDHLWMRMLWRSIAKTEKRLSQFQQEYHLGSLVDEQKRHWWRQIA